MDPIIIDRSRAEQYCDCPYAGFVGLCMEVLKASAENKTIFAWEMEIFKTAPQELVDKLSPFALSSHTSVLCDTGTEIHAVIDEAFEKCEGDLGLIPDWIVDNLPKVRPDIQPEAIWAARYVADVLADLHVTVIGTEVQIDHQLFPATASRGPVVFTMALDLLASGLNNCLHNHDWKTGFKRRSNTEAFNSFQAQSTALVLWKQPQYAEVEKIHFWYQEVRFGTKAYAEFNRSTEHPRLPHLSQEVAFQARIEEAVKLILANRKDAWPSPQKCCWCDAIRWCPHAHVDAMDIARDPKAFVDRMVVLGALLKRCKKAASDWLKGKGPIVGDKYVYDRKPPADKFTAEFTDRDPDRDYSKPRHIEIPVSSGDDSIDSHF
jgi:hypothetical protein